MFNRVLNIYFHKKVKGIDVIKHVVIGPDVHVKSKALPKNRNFIEFALVLQIYWITLKWSVIACWLIYLFVDKTQNFECFVIIILKNTESLRLICSAISLKTAFIANLLRITFEFHLAELCLLEKYYFRYQTFVICLAISA